MSMQVLHLNCATMCPRGGRLVGARGGPFAIGRSVCHCLLIEGREGLVLVDTGLGLDDCAQAAARLPWRFRVMARPRCDPEETAARQIERLGYRRGDVRHIVVTHLDADHAGGLPDFPRASVHVFHEEHAAQLHPRGALERWRSRRALWAYGPEWVVHRPRGERWLGFESVQLLLGTEPDVLLVPLPGHSRGHCGVAVRTADGWLLHAGDAYMSHLDLAGEGEAPLGTRVWQCLLAADHEPFHHNRRRLRELAQKHASEVRIVSSHCAVEFDRFDGDLRAKASAPRTSPEAAVELRP